MKKKLILRLGSMIKNAPKQHLVNHDYGFNFNHNTLMQKLINAEVIESDFWIHPDDYFKCLMAIDYFSNILFLEDTSISNLEYVFNEMKEVKSDFELTGGIISKELNLSALDFIDETSLDERIKGITERYEKSNIEFKSNGCPSIYYKIIGEMVYDLVSVKNKKYLKNVKGLSDLRALVFIDLMSDYYKPSLRSGFLKATIELLENIKQPEEESLDYIKDISKCFNDDSEQTLVTLVSETGISPSLVEKGLEYLVNKKVVAKIENYKDGVIYYLKHEKEVVDDGS